MSPIVINTISLSTTPLPFYEHSSFATPGSGVALGGSISVPLAPWGPTVGNELFMVLWQSGNVGTIGLPAGWTQIASRIDANATLIVASHTAAGGDPSQWTVTGTAAFPNQLCYGMFEYNNYAGVDGSVQTADGVMNGVATTVTGPAITTTTDDKIVAMFVSGYGGSVEFHLDPTPSGLFAHLGNSFVYLGDEREATPGTYGPWTDTFTDPINGVLAAGTAWSAFTMALTV